MKNKKIRNNRNRGFTLLEAMIASVILAVAASSIMLPLTTGAVFKNESERRVVGLQLGVCLMEKILSSDPDNIISNYDGFYESEGNIYEFGNQLTDPVYEGFSRKAECNNITINNCEFINIKVTVYHDGKELLNLERLVSP